MHKKYDHVAIERKWQERWQKSGIYNVGARDTAREKKYVLVEWPYPSGNLHIGHWFAFSVVDIFARYLRMKGYQVLFPMGFDAFGLPAENAAIKRGLDPKTWTFSNMAHMRTQLDSMGNCFSWDKTTNSTDPEYFTWTQWMFTEFFRTGLAYRGFGVVNWCPSCNTVLANEQVMANDTCERCGTKVVKREMPEWKIRITQYADRLIDDLADLEWPEYIKEQQRNWIGRSEGAEISFAVRGGPEPLKVFTTRPDTLYGLTFLAIAPEHPMLASLPLDNREQALAYVDAAKQKEEYERTNAHKEKTGIRLEGVMATHPVTGADIPIFVAEYVLGGYGTGAVMGVPAHDERDAAFAETHALPTVQVVDAAGVLLNSGTHTGMTSEEAKRVITEAAGGRLTNTYRIRDWSIGRQRYWGVPVPIVYDPSGNPHPIPREHLPWHLPEDVDITPDGEAPLARSAELRERTERIFGAGWTPDVETMDTFVDSSWYFLRYIDNADSDAFSSLAAQKDWMPVDFYFGGSEHTTMHLLYSRFWQKALFDLKLVVHSEPYVRRMNRGLVLGPDGNKMSKSKGNVVDPDEHVARVGADTVKSYLAFLGNYSEPNNYPWNLGGIAGIRRFFERVYGLSEHIREAEPESMTRLLHQTIRKVSEDIPEYKFNTALSALMVFVNEAESQGITQQTYETFLRLVAPFAPHVVEELWEAAGHTTSVHTESYPVFDPALATATAVTIGVQIAGKRRGDIMLSVDADEAAAVAAAQADPALAKYLMTGIKKVIYVQGRILNIIPE